MPVRVDRMLLTGLLAALPSANAYADVLQWLGDDSWYAGARVGLAPSISGDGRFFGPSQSVYGGSPVVAMDDGMQYTMLFGREIFAGLRLEFELSHVTSESDSSPVRGHGLRVDDVFQVDADLDSTLFMARIGYDFDELNWWAAPYLTVGIGVAETRTSARQTVEFNSPVWADTPFAGQRIEDQRFAEGAATELAWEVAAGFKRKLSNRWAVRLEYGFLNRGEAWTGVNEDRDAIKFSDLESQQLSFGLDWRFR